MVKYNLNAITAPILIQPVGCRLVVHGNEMHDYKIQQKKY